MTTPADTPGDHNVVGRGPAREGLLARIGRAAGRRPRRVLVLWALVALVAAPLAATLTGTLSGAGWEAQGSTAQEVHDELRRDFPQLGAEAAVIAYRQDTPIADNPAGLQALVAGLRGSPGTTTVPRPADGTAGLRPARPERPGRAGSGRAGRGWRRGPAPFRR